MSRLIAASPSQSSSTKTAWALGVGVGLVYAASATWVGPVSIDVQSTALEAWQWATTGQPWLDDLNLRWEGDGEALSPSGQLVEGREGIVTSRTSGVVLAAVPFYVVAGGPSATLAPSTGLAVLLASLAVVAMFLAVDSLTRRPVAIGAALAFGLASPTWSVSADALWTHSLTQAGIAGAAYAASRGRWWLVGTALGVAILGRTHMAVVALVVGLAVAYAQRRPVLALKVGIPSVVAVGVTLAANYYRYGSVSVSGGYDYATGSLASSSLDVWLDYLRNTVGFLVAPDRGFLLWSAVVVLLIPASLRAAKTAPTWVTALALGGLAYTAVQLKINSYAGGDSFYGYRHGLELLTCLLPLLTVAWAEVRHEPVRAAVIVLLYVQAALIATGAFFDSQWAVGNVLSGSAVVQLIGFMTLGLIAAWLTLRRLGGHELPQR